MVALQNKEYTHACKWFRDICNDEFRVTINDCMAVVQEMNKPHWIKTCEGNSNQFLVWLHEKDKGYVIHLIFDRIDEEVSLKVRHERNDIGQKPIP